MNNIWKDTELSLTKLFVCKRKVLCLTLILYMIAQCFWSSKIARKSKPGFLYGEKGQKEKKSPLSVLQITHIFQYRDCFPGCHLFSERLHASGNLCKFYVQIIPLLIDPWELWTRDICGKECFSLFYPSICWPLWKASVTIKKFSEYCKMGIWRIALGKWILYQVIPF